MNPNGTIKSQEDHVRLNLCDEIKIPLGEFISMENILGYLQTEQRIHAEDEQIYWNCIKCGQVTLSTDEPNGYCHNIITLCYEDLHRYRQLCYYSRKGILYQCQKCGAQVKTYEMPNPGRCADGSGHVWREM